MKYIVRSLFLFLCLVIVSPASAQQITAGSHLTSQRQVMSAHGAELVGHPGVWYDVKCFDTHHKLVWTRHVHNMLTTQGANLYVNSTIMMGVPVTSEADGNTAGSSTAVTFTFLQDTLGRTSTIMPGTVSFTIASYTGTFSDNGKGGIICTGTCTNFTASTSTVTYNTGAVALSFTSGGPDANAVTATYCYVATKYYVGLLYGSSAPTFATTDTLASNGWSPSAEVTGTQVTNSTRPIFTGSVVSAGSTNNTASVAVYTGNATVTLQGLIFTTSATLDETTSLLLGEATFTAAPIASGYTVQISLTDTITAG